MQVLFGTQEGRHTCTQVFEQTPSKQSRLAFKITVPEETTEATEGNLFMEPGLLDLLW